MYFYYNKSYAIMQSNTTLQATRYLIPAADVKCLQAVTWLVARGNKDKINTHTKKIKEDSLHGNDNDAEDSGSACRP